VHEINEFAKCLAALFIDIRKYLARTYKCNQCSGRKKSYPFPYFEIRRMCCNDELCRTGQGITFGKSRGIYSKCEEKERDNARRFT
jgi:hypothetical protein